MKTIYDVNDLIKGDIIKATASTGSWWIIELFQTNPNGGIRGHLLSTNATKPGGYVYELGQNYTVVQHWFNSNQIEILNR